MMLEVGDKVVAVKDNWNGWFRTGDVFTIVDVIEGNLLLLHSKTPPRKFWAFSDNFRLVPAKDLKDE